MHSPIYLSSYTPVEEIALTLSVVKIVYVIIINGQTGSNLTSKKKLPVRSYFEHIKSIFDDNRCCWSLYPFKWALCLMKTSIFYTLKDNNCNHSYHN